MKLISLSLVFFSSISAYAYKGSISFTDAEKADHASKIQLIADSAAQCLTDHYADHVAFFKKYKVSRYYGNRRYVIGDKIKYRADGHKLTPIGPELVKRGIDPKLQSQMTSISCVDLSRICLSKGFEDAGQSDYWKRIDAFNKENDNIGPAIEIGLQAIGWKLVYWNPDHTQNKDWDEIDQKNFPGNSAHEWGFHEAFYNSVMKKDTYYQYHVDDKTTLVDFGSKVPRAFLNVPFFMGFANVGYHVFLGTYGEAVEAHSVRDLFSLENIEMTEFNPLDGGAPKSTATEIYRSGLIAVPPSFL